MKLSSFLFGGLLTCSSLFLGSNAHGALAYDFPVGLPGNQTIASGSLGSVFTVTEPSGIWLNKLGAFDDGGSGFSAQINVAIFAVTVNPDNSIVGGSKIAVQQFSSTQAIPAGTLVTGTSTRTKDVAPVLLPAGSYIVVASGLTATGTEQFYNRAANQAGAIQPGPGEPGSSITFGGNYTNPNANYNWSGTTLPGTWTYDAGAVGWTPAYAAGNFDFTPVPEPVHFAFAGVSMLGLVYVGRGLWQARKKA